MKESMTPMFQLHIEGDHSRIVSALYHSPAKEKVPNAYGHWINDSCLFDDSEPDMGAFGSIPVNTFGELCSLIEILRPIGCTLSMFISGGEHSGNGFDVWLGSSSAAEKQDRSGATWYASEEALVGRLALASREAINILSNALESS